MQQVKDDPPLLELMLEDLGRADALYQPTNYWKRYQDRLLPYLRTQGLHDLRRPPEGRGAEVFDAFGVADRLEEAVVFRRLGRRFWKSPLGQRFPAGLRKAVEGSLASLGRRLIKTAPELDHWRRMRFEFVRREGERAGARPLEDFSVSQLGNPADLFEIDGHSYTTTALFYYLRYAYVFRFLDLDRAELAVELAAGSGKQAELLAKLHPRLTLCIFDLPPQLYVSHQYLSSVFPDRVVSYRECRELGDLSALEPGGIYLFGNGRMPLIRERGADLFWTAASLAEMEPDVVANYLRNVDPSTRNAYLMQNMIGSDLAARPGDFGVFNKTTIDDYQRGLPSFRLVDRTPSLRPDLRIQSVYEDSFWTRAD